MGLKVNANGLRIGINRGWESNWFASKKDYGPLLWEDIAIREYLDKELKNAMVSSIEIGRVKSDKGHKVTITVKCASPGVVLGQDGANKAKLVAALTKIVKSGTMTLDVVEVTNPDLDATLIAKWIASELENRQSFRSTQKKAIQRMRKAGASGCRTQCQGRLGGAEIARREGYKEGNVPLETLRADIDYAHVSAHTAYGRIGVKVWCCRSVNKTGENEKKGGENNVAAKAR